MSKHCQKQNCQKKNHNDCKKEKCCRYDSWCESDSSCGEVREQVKTIVIKQHKFCQDKKACSKWGFTKKCETSWECVPHKDCKEAGKYHKKH